MAHHIARFAEFDIVPAVCYDGHSESRPAVKDPVSVALDEMQKKMEELQHKVDVMSETQSVDKFDNRKFSAPPAFLPQKLKLRAYESLEGRK